MESETEIEIQFIGTNAIALEDTQLFIIILQTDKQKSRSKSKICDYQSIQY